MIQKTSDLALTVILTQKDTPPFEKVDDIDNYPAVWFSLVRLQLKILKKNHSIKYINIYY